MKNLLLLLGLLAAGCEVFLVDKGEDGEPCLGQDACAPGLVCIQGICRVSPGDGGDGDGDAVSDVDDDAGSDPGIDAGSDDQNDAGADPGADESGDPGADQPADGDPGGDEPNVDMTAPADIVDLTVTGVSESTITVTWTAPGDDGTTGTATSYDIRYSESPINESNFTQAFPPVVQPTPQPGGQTETFTLDTLTTGLQYYLAIKTVDEAQNWSGISNLVYATPTDMQAPEAVSDLSATVESTTSVSLTWTAPGDDQDSGTAESYDIRYSFNFINEMNFDACAQTDSAPGPLPAGTTQTITIGGLNQGQTYYFALKTSDEADNISPLSNVATATPGSTDVTPPWTINDLAITGFTATTVTLAWTAPGDDGQSGQASTYDLRYSSNPIASDGDFLFATAVPGVHAPQPAMSPETFTVNDLLDGGTYYFCLKTADEVPNWSGLSNPVHMDMVECTTNMDCVGDPEDQHYCKTSSEPPNPPQYTCVGCIESSHCESLYVCSDTQFTCVKQPCSDYTNPDQTCGNINPCYQCDTQSGHCRPPLTCTTPGGTGECCQGYTCTVLHECSQNHTCTVEQDCPVQMDCNADSNCEILTCCDPLCEAGNYCDSDMCECQPDCKGEGDPCNPDGPNACCLGMFCPQVLPFCTRF